MNRSQTTSGAQASVAPVARQRSASQPTMREMWQQLATAHHLPDLFLVVILSAVLSMLFYTNLVWVRQYDTSLFTIRWPRFQAD